MNDLLNLIEQYGELAFNEGCEFVRQYDNGVKYYAHAREQIFERIQQMIETKRASDE